MATTFPDPAPREQACVCGLPAMFVAGAAQLWINGGWLVPVVGPLAGFVSLQVFMIGRRMLGALHTKQQIEESVAETTD